MSVFEIDEKGHARIGFCNKCWGDAFLRMWENGRSQTENYRYLIDEHKKRESEMEGAWDYPQYCGVLDDLVKKERHVGHNSAVVSLEVLRFLKRMVDNTHHSAEVVLEEMIKALEYRTGEKNARS